MPLSYSVLDAFTSSPFSGNPAAIVVVPPSHDAQLDATLMQKIAKEFNLSETAFLRKEETKEGEEDGERWGLKWFTVSMEIDLCGHATLASAFLLFSLSPHLSKLYFSTRSGTLLAIQDPKSGLIELDFPADETVLTPVPEDDWERIAEGTVKAVGVERKDVINVVKTRDIGYIVELSKEVDMQNLKPDSEMIIKHTEGFLTITQASTSPDLSDINSRVFGPAMGNPEDPVTGSSHCCLVPYWLGSPARSRLLSPSFKEESKMVLNARQVSPRGGFMQVEWKDGRCKLRGKALEVMRGELLI